MLHFIIIQILIYRFDFVDIYVQIYYTTFKTRQSRFKLP